MPSTFPNPPLLRGTLLFLGLLLSGIAGTAVADALSETQGLMKQGQWAKALDKVEVVIAQKPREASGRFLKGVILDQLGRDTEAMAVFTQLSEDFPELPEPHNNLAVLYARQKQYDKARLALEMAIRTHPTYPTAHENLGDVYVTLAGQAYERAAQLDSSNKGAKAKLSVVENLVSRSSVEKNKLNALSSQATRLSSGESVHETVVITPAAGGSDVPKAAGHNDDEAAVRKALLTWANAWSQKDVQGYLDHYAADFQKPQGMSRKAWESDRAQRIRKPDQARIEVDDIKISIVADKATVRFRQHYTSPSLRSTVSKLLVFVRSGDRWLIYEERVA